MKVTQTQIARRVGMDVSSVNKILNRRQGAVFKKETIRRVLKVARELGYDFEKIKHHHQRRHLRREVAMEADVRVYHEDGSLFDKGTATIRDLSEGGARITDLELSQGKLPAAPFSVELRPRARPLESMEMRGRLVRFDAPPSFGFGIKFTDLDLGHQRRIRRYVESEA